MAAVLQRALGSRVPLLGQAANLGRCGMQLHRCRGEGEAPLPQDTPLSVSFELPDGGALVTVAAQLVFERAQDGRTFSAGLRFCDLDPALQQRLERYLDQPL